MSLPHLLFIGTGVGKDLRGFEAHIQDLFDHMKNEPGFTIHLAKGSPKKDPLDIQVPCLHRKSIFARLAGLLLRKDPFFIQQISFFIGLLPTLHFRKPSIIYLGEPVLFKYLYRWRNFSGIKFRLIFYSGGNTVPLKMKQDDFLQLVTPVLIKLATQRGILAQQMKVIPHFIDTWNESNPEGINNRAELRKRLGLPNEKLIILSVGAVDSSVKRMDYLIKEVSKLSVPYFLVILGEFERETDQIKRLAETKIGKGNFYLSKIPRMQLNKFYAAADIFVLASLDEGFGLVTIEALLHGLPVLVHRNAVMEYVLGEFGSYSDFTVENNLTRLIESTIPQLNNVSVKQKRRKYVVDRFDWKALSGDYQKMFKEVAENSSTLSG